MDNTPSSQSLIGTPARKVCNTFISDAVINCDPVINQVFQSFSARVISSHASKFKCVSKYLFKAQKMANNSQDH